jgi:putative endonuclease
VIERDSWLIVAIKTACPYFSLTNPLEVTKHRQHAAYMRNYYVYILRCSDRSYYTGVTNSYERRLMEHQTGLNPTCYTFKRRPVTLMYTAWFTDIYEAIHWEKVVKGWSRKKKEALIQGDFKRIDELSRNMYARRIHGTIAMVRALTTTIFVG